MGTHENARCGNIILKKHMTRVSPINQTKVALFAIALYLLSGNGTVAGNKKYISKTMVDTLIQNAFVHLNASSDNMPGSDLRRKQAVTDAKRVAARLRTIARGDPNEKYVLWKTGELSSQIYLEERDIVLKKLEKAQKEKNAIIAIFNAELGKKRPDFMILKKAGDDMMAWDPSKAREIQWSLDQRSLNISREVIYTLEKAFLTGNIEKIQNEFNYCKKNRLLLRISSQKFNRLDARIAALGEAIKLKPAVDDQPPALHHLFPH